MGWFKDFFFADREEAYEEVQVAKPKEQVPAQVHPIKIVSEQQPKKSWCKAFKSNTNETSTRNPYKDGIPISEGRIPFSAHSRPAEASAESSSCT